MTRLYTTFTYHIASLCSHIASLCHTNIAPLLSVCVHFTVHLHHYTLHCIALYIALHYIACHFIALNIALHYIAIYIALHYIAIIACHFIALNIALYYIALECIALMTWQYISLHCVAVLLEHGGAGRTHCKASYQDGGWAL